MTPIRDTEGFDAAEAAPAGTASSEAATRMVMKGRRVRIARTNPPTDPELRAPLALLPQPRHDEAPRARERGRARGRRSPLPGRVELRPVGEPRRRRVGRLRVGQLGAKRRAAR